MKTTQGKKLGPPTKLTPERRVQLKEAAAYDASVPEMAYLCDVSKQTVYNWLENDKDLFDEIERLRQKPVLLARQTAIKKIPESYNNAVDYLKRKKKLEFGDKMDVTSNDEKLETGVVILPAKDIENHGSKEESSQESSKEGSEEKGS